MLVLLNTAFDEWAQRFDELRAATDCPPMSAIDFLTGGLTAPETGGAAAWDAYSKWLAKPGMTAHDSAFIAHCGREGRAQIRHRKYKPSAEQRAERVAWAKSNARARTIEHTLVIKGESP